MASGGQDSSGGKVPNNEEEGPSVPTMDNDLHVRLYSYVAKEFLDKVMADVLEINERLHNLEMQMAAPENQEENPEEHADGNEDSNVMGNSIGEADKKEGGAENGEEGNNVKEK